MSFIWPLCPAVILLFSVSLFPFFFFTARVLVPVYLYVWFNAGATVSVWLSGSSRLYVTVHFIYFVCVGVCNANKYIFFHIFLNSVSIECL